MIRKMIKKKIKNINSYNLGVPRGVMLKAMDYAIIIYELLSRYYVQFGSNTRGKGMTPLIIPTMGWIVPLLFFYKDGFGIKWPMKVEMT